MAPTSSSEEPSWAELLGSSQWANLLNPMDPTLGSWLSRWGDMAQVTYDAFNKNKDSINFASCLYNKAELLKKTGFPYDSNYRVVDLLYASITSPILEEYLPPSIARVAGSNFQGYIAVSSDEYAKETGQREICVAWRGTQTTAEHINNLSILTTSVSPLQSSPSITSWVMGFLSKVVKYGVRPIRAVVEKLSGEPQVAEAWYHVYTESNSKSSFSKYSARAQLLVSLRKLVSQYKDEELSIVCVGHSLGGALAVLSAFDIVQQGLSKKGENDHFPVTAVTFACPRVGNNAFSQLLNKQPKLNVIHVKNKGDIVPSLPPALLAALGGYVDIGVTIELDPRKSERLRSNPGYGELHSLKNVLHVLLRTWRKMIKFMSPVNVYVKPEEDEGMVMKEEEQEEEDEEDEEEVMNEEKEEGEECEPELPNIVLMLEPATANAAGASAAAATVPAT